MIEQNYNLDTIPFSSAVPVVHVSQYDSGSRTLKFKLLAGGSNYDMTGVTGAQINGRKPDGTEFSYNMTISNDVVSIVITEQMAAVAGRVMAEVVLTGANSSVLGTANFIIEVEKSPLDEAVISDTEIPIIMDFVTGGTPGQIFKRTATGGEWVDDTVETVEWGGIEGDIADQEDLKTALDGKIANPTGGSVGQVLKKTATGTEWADESGGTVKTVNNISPDANGNVDLDATDIPTSSGVAIKSLTGNPLTISDALQGRALGVNVSIEPIQSGSGDPSPTNIRPISGISTLEIANNGTTEITVALGQTVYGGTLNVTTGELVVDRASVDMGTLNWGPIQRGDQFAFYTDGINTLKKIGIYNLISSSYKTVGIGYGYEFSNMVNGDISGQSKNGNIFVKNDNFPYTTSGARDFKNAVSGVQIVYELATPIEITLTPAQLNLLSSTNILTTNAEDLTVRYYATGQQGNVEGNIAFLLGQTASNASAITALSESVAPIETGTATQNYSVGNYLLLNGQFCKVTAAIATGETITVGTNVDETSVGEEIGVNALYYKKGEFFEIPSIVYCHSLTSGSGLNCSAFLAMPKMAREGQTFTYNILGNNVRTNSAVATPITVERVTIRGNVLIIDFSFANGIGYNQIANVALNSVRIDFTS